MDYTGGALDTPVDVLIFGDSSNPYDAELNLLLQVHDCDVLSSFFEHVHYALRFEISRLPIAQQEMFPRFTCLSDVLASTCKSGSNPALELFLLSLTQLGRFIKYAV